MLLNFAYEIRKVVNRDLAKILYCIEAVHAVTLELRFGEKLVSRALVRKCFAPCKIFVDVTRFIAESYWALRTFEAVRRARWRVATGFQIYVVYGCDKSSAERAFTFIDGCRITIMRCQGATPPGPLRLSAWLRSHPAWHPTLASQRV